jgi:transposase-like protein
MDGEHAAIERDGSVRSGHKGSHMPAPTQRIEVITRGERRRRWSIVAESLGARVRPIEIIHKHGITSGQLYAWRQQLTRRMDGPPSRPPAGFARVDVVAAEREVVAKPVTEMPPTASKPQARVPAVATLRAKGLIEIVLPGGTSVRVDAHVDDRALRCVLDALHAR